MARHAAHSRIGSASAWDVLSAATTELEEQVKHPHCACCQEQLDASIGMRAADSLLEGLPSGGAKNPDVYSRASLVLPCMHVTHASCWQAWTKAHQELWRTGKAGRAAMEVVRSRMVGERGAIAEL